MNSAIRKPGRVSVPALMGLCMAITGPAFAEPVSLALDYTCVFPMIEEQPLAVTIRTDLPSSVRPGESIEDIRIEADATVGEGAWNGLYFVGSRTLEGEARADVVLEAPGMNFPFSVPMTLDKTSLPDERGTFEVVTHGSTPRLSFREPGEATLTVKDLVLSLVPKDHQDRLTGLGEFQSECVVDSGQDQVLHRLTVEDDRGTPVDMKLRGESRIQAAGDSVALEGRLAGTLGAGTGNSGVELSLEPTHGDFAIVRFWNLITAKADIEFEPVNGASGALEGGAITLQSRMHINLPRVEVHMLGVPIPVGGGPDCRTSEPVTMELATPSGEAFDPSSGGNLEGTYTLPPVENCGGLDGLINLFMAGPGNTVEASLSASP